MSTTRFPSLPKPLFGISKDWKPNNDKRIVMHIDMNAFFASVEQAHRPHLRGKPVIISADPYGTPKGRRSVAATASYEARKFGVRTGMPLFLALKFCPHVLIVEGNGAKYSHISLKFLDILETFTDLVEPYSIDEAFIDVTHTAHLFGGKVKIAKEIKRKVKENFGITCSVGIAPNKLVAKMASEMEKPDGLVVIEKKELPEVLWSLPIDKIPGIGKKRKVKLNLMGINTIGDLATYPRENLRRALGIVGEYLQCCAWGKDDGRVIPSDEIPKPKSISSASTFKKNTVNKELIISALFYLTEKAVMRAKKHRMKAKAVGAWIRYGDFTSEGNIKKIKSEISTFRDAFFYTKKIISEYLPARKPVRLVGVCLSDLYCKEFENLPIFDREAKHKKIDELIQKTRQKTGRRSIYRARSLIGEKLVLS